MSISTLQADQTCSLTFISDMTGRKAEVPAEDTKIVQAAVMPTTKVGYAMA